jgi:molybdenum cofactor synthesis domain-containing protein
MLCIVGQRPGRASGDDHRNVGSRPPWGNLLAAVERRSAPDGLCPRPHFPIVRFPIARFPEKTAAPAADKADTGMTDSDPELPSVAAEARIVTACVLVIGNEILSGRTQDENLGFLARELNEAGIRLREARVIPDVPEVIIATVNEVRRQFDYVFTTGGIGPTHDDITAQSMADAFEVRLVVHPEARRLLETHYPAGHLNEARLRMAMVPEGAALLPNPISRAPGFQIGNVFVLPGVPSIMQGIFEQLKYRLVGGEKMLSRSVSCRLGEGNLATDLAALQDRYPDLEIGSYPYFRRGDFGVTLVLRGTDRARLGEATEELKALIHGLGGDPQEGLSEG